MLDVGRSCPLNVDPRVLLKKLRRELYETVDRLGASVFYNSQVESEDICFQYDAVCNTAIEDWKGLQIKNLFHAFGTAAEYRIAAAVYAGGQIVKYLHE